MIKISNSYSRLINLLKKEEGSKEDWGIATVISLEPLKLKYKDLVLDKDFLLISEELTSNYEEKISLTEMKLSGETDDARDGHIHKIKSLEIAEGKIIKEDYFSLDDKVFIVSVNEGQLYIILAKVVGL